MAQFRLFRGAIKFRNRDGELETRVLTSFIQGRNNTLFVIDDLALRSTLKQTDVVVANQSGEILIDMLSSAFKERTGYDINVFIEKFIKPVTLIQTYGIQVILPSGDPSDSISTPQELEAKLSDKSFLETFTEQYTVEVALNPGATCIATPAYGHLTRRLDV